MPCDRAWLYIFFEFWAHYNVRLIAIATASGGTCNAIFLMTIIIYSNVTHVPNNVIIIGMGTCCNNDIWYYNIIIGHVPMIIIIIGETRAAA